MKSRKTFTYLVTISLPADATSYMPAGTKKEGYDLIRDLLIHSSNCDNEPDRVKCKKVTFIPEGSTILTV